MNLLDLDSRWKRFNDPDRVCPCCGETFSGIFDLGYPHPDAWTHAVDDSGDTEIAGDRLNADLCRVGEACFLRCVLMIPVQGTDEMFGFGAWAQVSRDVFDGYLATYDEPPRDFAGGNALLANLLPGFTEDDMIPVILSPVARDAGTRPMMMAEAGDLATAQTDGISFDRLLDIYAEAGRDIRPHLMQD
ncbi:hypothetical protein DI396_05910 [Litorivita pollutaquae]|uniref:DUF2199 domain-containing protein n=1 Tax=Litorivita pollutaquae TaxID=2200892 RepID=A0A2V4MP60_9RHOB|nr:DUF2199 domain-containing protein [Litorivita pollutaquae]OUS22035.1 hypothetical protein A9Q95_03050 [Rhodobacterales bacterium 59_46_T64]PYC48505.1 hypothetical protein DI396_05910 [Litorivita pollutaquae]